MLRFIELTKRNMRIYLRDRGAVFFSLLSMVIVLILMLVFLGDMSVDSLINGLAEMPDRNAETDRKNAELMITLWTCAGIVAINAPTVTLAVYSAMIKDRSEGRLASIYTAPVSRISITSSYIASAWLCSVIICTITLVISEIYCIIKGMEIFSAAAHLTLFGMICANSFTYASFMYLLALFVKTEGAWSGIGTVIGTLVGFLGGIYLPMGSVSESIGNILKCTPVIYGAKMFRSIMTEDITDTIFADVPDHVKADFLEDMGITLEFFGNDVSNTACMILLVLCGIIFLMAGAAVTRKAARSHKS